MGGGGSSSSMTSSRPRSSRKWIEEEGTPSPNAQQGVSEDTSMRGDICERAYVLYRDTYI